MPANHRQTKNEKRRNKKKTGSGPSITSLNSKPARSSEEDGTSALLENGSSITVEYVSADYKNDKDVDEEMLNAFLPVFQKITRPEELLSAVVTEDEDAGNRQGEDGEHALALTDGGDRNGEKKLSKKKKKLMNRLSVSELKQLVSRPDVVEAHDVTSSDPRLLVHLKSARNTVPVPRHWCQIRKYLQGKRGQEKAPFQLPEFIAETGIAKIRESVMELDALKKGKQKARERVKPKMGKIDIDYQVLHDAFFKYQTKPKLTIHGDLYYEGKEFEVNMSDKKPGVYSAELLAALGMQERSPPPWLVNMQRYGLPPSYPGLKVPGVNAPLPAGGQYGFQPGGWGRPPVDEYGRPLYGDVFGVGLTQAEEYDAVDKSFRWGALDPEVEDEDYDDDEDDEELDEAQDQGAGGFDPSGAESVVTLDGTGSESAPDFVDLRKRAQGSGGGTETPDTVFGSSSGGGAHTAPKELYHVIQEKQEAGTAGAAGQLFGSERTYVLPGQGDVQISINPDDLEDLIRDKSKLKEIHDERAAIMSSDQMKKLIQGGSGAASVDGSSSIVSGTATQKKRKIESAANVNKKYKEFKF